MLYGRGTEGQWKMVEGERVVGEGGGEKDEGGIAAKDRTVDRHD